MRTILIIEDDMAISTGLEAIFTADNYNVIVANDGVKGFKYATSKNPDLIVLDIMLPEKNGLEVCKDLRAIGFSAPILMLTSRNEEIDKVLGLEIGADDYVTKPFSVRELLARVKVLFRRNYNSQKEFDEFSFNNIKLDFKKQEAYKENKPLKLSTTEFKILKLFIEHQGEVVTRDLLLDKVWGFDAYPTTRTVDNFILSIRKQIEDNPANPKHLVTVHKAGYKLVI